MAAQAGNSEIEAPAERQITGSAERRITGAPDVDAAALERMRDDTRKTEQRGTFTSADYRMDNEKQLGSIVESIQNKDLDKLQEGVRKLYEKSGADPEKFKALGQQLNEKLKGQGISAEASGDVLKLSKGDESLSFKLKASMDLGSGELAGSLDKVENTGKGKSAAESLAILAAKDSPEEAKTQREDAKPEQSPEQILLNPKATAEDKIRAAHFMAKSGQSQFKAEDGTTYKIDIDNYGKRDGVVISASGMTAMRGIIDKTNSEVTKQKSSKGEVDYVSNTAKRLLKDNPLISFGEEKSPELKPGQVKDQSKPEPVPVEPVKADGSRVETKDKAAADKDKVIPAEKGKDEAAPPEEGIPKGFKLAQEIKNGWATEFGYKGNGGGKFGFRHNPEQGRIHKLYTIQDVLEGRSEYASVALSYNNITKHWKGNNLDNAPVVVIPELDQKYAAFLQEKGLKHFPFKAMDHGPAVSSVTVDLRTDVKGEIGGRMRINPKIYAKEPEVKPKPKK